MGYPNKDGLKWDFQSFNMTIRLMGYEWNVPSGCAKIAIENGPFGGTPIFGNPHLEFTMKITADQGWGE